MGRCQRFQSWGKSCLSCFIVCCSWYAEAADWCAQPEFNLNGLSKHFDDANRPTDDERNEVNTGLGLTCQLKGIGGWRDELEGGFYKNSHFKNSFYIAYGIYYPVNSVIFLGLRNAIITGYPSGNSGSGIVAGPLPSMKIGLNPVVTLNLSVTPKRNAVVFANLGFKF
jgi:hypothetical protein